MVATLLETIRKMWKGGASILNGTCVRLTLIALYFLLPAVSQVITYAHFCQPFDDGTGDTKSFMTIDMIIPCGDKHHKRIETYALIMVSGRVRGFWFQDRYHTADVAAWLPRNGLGCCCHAQCWPQLQLFQQ